MPAISTTEAARASRPRRAGGQAETDPVSYETMAGQGRYVTIEGTRYEIAPVPNIRLREFGEIISRCPELLVTHTLAALETGEFDIERTAKLMRRTAENNGQAAEAVAHLDPGIMTQALCAAMINLTDDEIAAMPELVALVLRRKHPEVTAETFAETLDVPTFLDVLLVAFLANPNLANRFSPPVQTNAA